MKGNQLIYWLSPQVKKIEMLTESLVFPNQTGVSRHNGCQAILHKLVIRLNSLIATFMSKDFFSPGSIA